MSPTSSVPSSHTIGALPAHVPRVVVMLSSDSPLGRTSVSTTFLAVDWPMFATRIVKLARPPAFTTG